MATDPISARLAARNPMRIDLSLERVRALLAAVGDPHERLPPVVHVAGTNGKGSTVAFLRAMAEAAGLRVHVNTSPHLVRFNERIRLAGRLIEDAEIDAILDRLEAVDGSVQATVFEMTTAAAFLAMAEVPADLAIVEVGLGGRLDATNVVDPRLSVITPVDLDHAEFLGGELVGVAGEKAGILKPGRPAVIARQQDAAMAVIEARAAEVGAPLTVMGVDFDAWAERGGLAFQNQERFLDLPAPALTGPHQIANAGLAVAAALELGLSEAAIAEGLRSVAWPARMQRLTAGSYARQVREAELWLDGGHNPHAAAAMREALLSLQARDPRPLALIVGMLSNKDAGGFFEALRGLDAPVFTVAFEGACHDPASLADAARRSGFEAAPAASVEAALDQAPAQGAGRILICGSLYLAGEVLGASPETWPA